MPQKARFMIIIQLAGGLGNQMFQYALSLQLKSLGKEVKIDDEAGFVQDAKRDPALMPFGITYERPTAEELRRMLDNSMLPWSRVRRKLFGRNKKSYFEADKRYHAEIMTWDDIYLEGYWQSERYFADVTQAVRAAYDTDKLLCYVQAQSGSGGADKVVSGSQQQRADKPRGDAQRTAEQWLSQIQSGESVSVHIRRGDYLLPENQLLFGGICTEAYYRSAMARMRRMHTGCRFYLFTNDKKWLREQITAAGADRATEENDADDAAAHGMGEAAGMGKTVTTDDIEIVALPDTAGSETQRDYAEFALMSKCRHHILANSSYSWWASYLCDHPQKTVLAPDRWLNGWDCTDLYRDDMQKVRTDSVAQEAAEV